MAVLAADQISRICGMPVPGRRRNRDDPSCSLRANAYAERFLLTARTEPTDCTPIFSERHPGLGVCSRKPHGSCGLVHGVRKDRKCSFRYGVYQIAAARRGQPWQKEQANKCLESL